MREEAPEGLVNLLEHLQLADRSQIEHVAPRVRRLAGEFPDFDSVWVDALLQARVISPFQAEQINAGRGESLVCGPFVLVRRLASPYYAECFEARHLETGQDVRLYRVLRPQAEAAQAARELLRLIEQLRPLEGPSTCAPRQAGICEHGVWAACRCVDGVTAAGWMAEYGRFPPQVVLHIARKWSPASPIWRLSAPFTET